MRDTPLCTRIDLHPGWVPGHGRRTWSVPARTAPTSLAADRRLGCDLRAAPQRAEYRSPGWPSPTALPHRPGQQLHGFHQPRGHPEADRAPRRIRQQPQPAASSLRSVTNGPRPPACAPTGPGVG